MINEKRIKHMIRLASYEKKSGAEDLKIQSYFKKDYISINVWFSALWVTLGYMAIVAIVVMSKLEAMLEEVTIANVITWAGTIIIGYFIVLILYLCFATFFYRKKYQNAKQNAKKYAKDLHSLEKMYEREGV